MDFMFNEDQKMLRNSLRDFLEKEMAPMVKEKEPQGRPLNHEEAVDALKKFKKMGLSPDIEDMKAFGGDASLIGIMAEEIGRVYPGIAIIIGYSIGIGALIQFLPDGMEIKERLLPRIKRSEVIATYSLTEPDAGSDSRAIKTKAVLDGGEYIINGRKTWATTGPISDLCLLVVKDEKEQQQMFLVDRERSPYESNELGHMGLKLTSTGELFFDNCRVPKDNNLTNIMAKIGNVPILL